MSVFLLLVISLIVYFRLGAEKECLGLDCAVLGSAVREEFFGGAGDVTFWEGVFVSSVVWIVVCLFAYMRGILWSFDNRLNWGEGFDSGWDSALEVVKNLEEMKNGKAD